MTDPSGPPPSDAGDQATYAFVGPMLPAALTARYDITERLGAGGMGVVYKARDRETGATVALKVIHPAISSQPGIAERFKAELLLARQITHKNVCRVYDLNRYDDVLVIAMEYVEGERLRDLMNRKQRLSIDETRTIAGQVMAALREAHAQGIVHRDIKPENILITRDGTVRLMDFGLARSADSAHSMTGAVLGTPAYMAPEQAEGRPIDRRTDIYALGLVLYEMLTGTAAFSGDTPITIALKQIHDTPVPPATLEPTIPHGLNDAILRCLEKDPAKRFQTIDALEDGIDDAPVALPPARPQSPTRRWKVALVGVGVLAVIAALTITGLRRPSSLEILVRKVTMENGLRVVLSEDHSVPTFSICVTYNAGSRDERPGKTGYAHLFEHMMFAGSRNVGKGEHFLLVMNNGGDMNGTTNPDRTIYFQTMSANQLDLALFLEADRMHSLAINETNLENQRRVVIEERRQGIDNQPYGRTFEAIQETAYDSFAYKHSTIGSIEDLNAATVNDLTEFFKVYYAPGNAVLTLVGDFKSDDAVAKIRKYFGGIPGQPAPPAPDTAEPEQRSERRRIVDDPFAQAQRIDVVYKAPSSDTPEWYALEVASGILGEGQSSRLYQKLVKATEVAVSVSSGLDMRRGPSLATFTVVARSGRDTKQIEKLLYEEIDRLKNEPVSGETLARVRRQFRTQHAKNYQRTLTRAIALGEFEMFYGRPDLVNTMLGKWERVSAEDVQRVARTYLSESRRSVILTNPAGRPSAPASEPIADKSLPLSRIERKGRAPVSTDILRVKPRRAVETVLENGLTVVILEDHRFPTVAVQLGISGAESVYEPPEHRGLASMTAQMIRQGSKTRSSKQIAEGVDDLGATLAISSGSSGTNLYATGLSDNFDAWFGLAADVLLHPVFPVDELNGLGQRLKTQLRQARATPSFLANERFYQAVFGDHPAHAFAGTPETIDAIRPEMLGKWYSETYTPENAILAIIGDVRADRVLSTVRATLGSWQKTGRKEGLPPNPTRAGATRIQLVDRPHSSQTTLVLGNIAIDRRDPDYIPVRVMNHILGGEPTGRLSVSLREERGYTYRINTSFNALKYAGPWQLVSNVRADATEDALRQILLEVRRLREEPVPQAELEEARRALAARFALSQEDPAQVLSDLQVRKTYGFSADYWDTYPAKILEVTAADVQRVARKYIDPDALVIVAVGDRQRIEPMLARFGPLEVFDTEGRSVR